MTNSGNNIDNEYIDTFYANLVETTQFMDEGTAQKFLVKLTLLLASQVANPALLPQIIEHAKASDRSDKHTAQSNIAVSR